MGSFHLSREMALLGNQVAHVSTPVSALHAVAGVDPARRSLLAAGPSRAEDGVLDFVPRSMFPVRWGWSRRSLERILDRIEFDSVDFCFVDQPLMAARTPRIRTVIFRPTDIKTHRIDAARANKVMANIADGLAATSPFVADSLPNPRAVPTIVIENGCEVSRFQRARASSHGRSGFVYVGAMDHRFDFDAVRRVAIEFPTEEVHLYGPVPESAPSIHAEHPNILFEGVVGYEQVPDVLSRAKVGLLPFTRTAANRGRSPMKLYEYLAAGLRVVSSEKPRADERINNAVFSYGSLSELPNAASRALGADVDYNAVDAMIAGKDWSQNANRLLAFAGNVASSDRARG